ncbi:MAG: NAD(P)-binding domain-containing protein [Steroidobacteraceae bacterium]
MSWLLYIVYAIPLLLIWGIYTHRRRSVHAASSMAYEDSRSAGLLEPASLHPVINANLCVGCGSCVKACPEQPEHHVLGLINGKAQLVSPTDCIGHGACKIACPMDAISLVFGTETRGVDIPLVNSHFETNVPGIFVAGELGGMGLIRNALEQGRQAVDAICQHRPRGKKELDLVIVGAGPAGFAASLAAKAKGLRFVTLEQESLGGCVFQYPRGKLVMTAPATLPIVGTVNFRNTSKENLLQFWRETESKAGLKINYKERVDVIINLKDQGFLIRTPTGEYVTRNVLLAIGRRGTPRKLGVPGEDLPKVVYRLIDPEQYAHQRVLIVGGGDSALEAATSIAAIDGAHVTLSYRGAVFDRAKPSNRQKLEAAVKAGAVDLRLASQVKQIESESVTLIQEGRQIAVENNSVIVNAGGVLPNDFLRKVGIAIETKYGTA